MSILKRVFTWFALASLLAGCGNAALWGSMPTPTAAPRLTEAPGSEGTPTPSPTPFQVLPMLDSPTPGPIASSTGPGPVSTVPPVASPTFPPVNSTGPLVRYISQGGDTLDIVAKRFGVVAGEIISDVNLPAPGLLLEPGTLLLVPNHLPPEMSPGAQTIPDSEIPYGLSSADFDIAAYVNQQNGYLAKYTEYLMSYGTTTGSQAVRQISLDNSLSPRIVLAIIEYESHWVLGQPTNIAQGDYPLGYHSFYYQRLFRQLMWASGQLSDGYYKWLSGDLTDLTFTDGSTLRIDPRLNAGTVAIQYFFSRTHDRASWDQAVAGSGFPALYRRMFGDPWQRARTVEPLISPGLTQPPLTLPFERGRVWSFSGGPHSVWELEGGALAALDFAPAASAPGCVKSEQWIVAPAAGVIVRAGDGLVMLDMDGDGIEQTGWDMLFLHVATLDRIAVGTVVQPGDRIGHPSCEGGGASGTHVHIARKYNGEWILADGPMPFDMDGWVAHYDGTPYKGRLVRGDAVIEACACGTFATRIIRDR
jgi:LasA protease